MIEVRKMDSTADGWASDPAAIVGRYRSAAEAVTATRSLCRDIALLMRDENWGILATRIAGSSIWSPAGAAAVPLAAASKKR